MPRVVPLSVASVGGSESSTTSSILRRVPEPIARCVVEVDRGSRDPREMEDFEVELARTRRRRLRVAAAIGVLTLLAVVAWSATPIRRFFRGEVDWAGERVYEPPHPIDTAALQRIDLRRVHGELLPGWVLAAAGEAQEGAPVASEETAYLRLREEIAADPNLVDLLDTLRTHVRDGGLHEDPERALWLAWAWSTYVDRAGYPFLVHGSVLGTRQGPVFSAIVYETAADASVSVGTEVYRVRVGSRIDGTNVRELYLGAAGRDEAIVVVDRLAEFATADLWPLFEPALDEVLTDRAAFGPAIRAEAQARLPSGSFDALQAHAVRRWSIVETVVRVHERRRVCGSGLQFNSVPWYGFEPERIRRLRDMAERDANDPCPAITADEVDALETASRKLLADRELQPAVEALVAWTAEHVAIHEARHLADDANADGFDAPLPCRSCAENMGIVARAELSGYLASLAWSPSPATALYQACRAIADDRRWHGGRGVNGPHAEAMALLQRRLGPICGKPPLEDLSGLGRVLEDEMLGRSEPMSLSDDFPRRLPIPRPPAR